jgi:DNA-binding GntR family transcriptional regulator
VAKHRNLEEQAYQHIRRAIIARRWQPGSRLSEPQIADELGISRTPIRNAMRRLAADGMVALNANLGAQVMQPSQELVRDTYFMREILEPEAIALACRHIRPSDTVRLDELRAEEVEAFRARDLERYMAVNDAFHGLIASLSGNAVLEEAVKKYLTMTNVFLSLLDPFYTIGPDEMDSFREHGEIVRHLARGDGASARAAMIIHIRSSRSCLRLTRIANECEG